MVLKKEAREFGSVDDKDRLDVGRNCGCKDSYRGNDTIQETIIMFVDGFKVCTSFVQRKQTGLEYKSRESKCLGTRSNIAER